MEVKIKPYQLEFKKASGTSRGILRVKNGWFIVLKESEDKYGIGECSIIEGLSPDSHEDLQNAFKGLQEKPKFLLDHYKEKFANVPALAFAIETALQDLAMGGQRILFPSSFTENQAGVCINGLIWMGEKEFMFEQIKEKIDAGFRCIKLKIGAIDFQQELDLLRYIRGQFTKEDIELRVDANGAFSPKDALEKLKQLSQFDLHSIEQPIAVKQPDEMALLCETSPLDIALDEELIGCLTFAEKQNILETIQPQYIILKPSLIGGFRSAEEWIRCAEELKISWWATSALESNIGLNAIAQWTAIKNSKMPQGLGTGKLYTNNITSPLEINGEFLYHNTNSTWDLTDIIP